MDFEMGHGAGTDEHHEEADGSLRRCLPTLPGVRTHQYEPDSRHVYAFPQSKSVWPASEADTIKVESRTALNIR